MYTIKKNVAHYIFLMEDINVYRIIVLLIVIGISSTAINAADWSSIRTAPYYGGSLYKPNTSRYTTKTYNRGIKNIPIHQHHPNCRAHNRSYYPYRDLSALERYALKKNYLRENNLARLERLEDLAFGATQTGDFNTRYKNVEAAILSQPQNSYKKSILGNLANYFAGQATGFTPNIDSFSPNYTNFGGYSFNPYTVTPGLSNHNIEHYSGMFGTKGFRQMGSDYGSGSTIRILD